MKSCFWAVKFDKLMTESAVPDFLLTYCCINSGSPHLSPNNVNGLIIVSISPQNIQALPDPLKLTWKFSFWIWTMTPTVCGSIWTMSPNWNWPSESTPVAMSVQSCRSRGNTLSSCIVKSENKTTMFSCWKGKFSLVEKSSDYFWLCIPIA